MTPEQVLNHLLPVISGLKPGLKLDVEYKQHKETKPLKIKNKQKTLE